MLPEASKTEIPVQMINVITNVVEGIPCRTTSLLAWTQEWAVQNRRLLLEQNFGRGINLVFHTETSMPLNYISFKVYISVVFFFIICIKCPYPSNDVGKKILKRKIN